MQQLVYISNLYFKYMGIEKVSSSKRGIDLEELNKDLDLTWSSLDLICAQRSGI